MSYPWEEAQELIPGMCPLFCLSFLHWCSELWKRWRGLAGCEVAGKELHQLRVQAVCTHHPLGLVIFWPKILGFQAK